MWIIITSLFTNEEEEEEEEEGGKADLRWFWWWWRIAWCQRWLRQKRKRRRKSAGGEDRRLLWQDDGRFGFLWWRWWLKSWRWWQWLLGWRRERECEETDDKKRKILGRKTGFRPTLDPIISTHGASRSNLFIGGERGTFCFFWCKISALDSTRKHPNYCYSFFEPYVLIEIVYIPFKSKARV